MEALAYIPSSYEWFAARQVPQLVLTRLEVTDWLDEHTVDRPRYTESSYQRMQGRLARYLIREYEPYQDRLEGFFYTHLGCDSDDCWYEGDEAYVPEFPVLRELHLEQACHVEDDLEADHAKLYYENQRLLAQRFGTALPLRHASIPPPVWPRRFLRVGSTVIITYGHGSDRKRGSRNKRP